MRCRKNVLEKEALLQRTGDGGKAVEGEDAVVFAREEGENGSVDAVVECKEIQCD